MQKEILRLGIIFIIFPQNSSTVSFWKRRGINLDKPGPPACQLGREEREAGCRQVSQHPLNPLRRLLLCYRLDGATKCPESWQNSLGCVRSWGCSWKRLALKLALTMVVGHHPIHWGPELGHRLPLHIGTPGSQAFGYWKKLPYWLSWASNSQTADHNCVSQPSIISLFPYIYTYLYTYRYPISSILWRNLIYPHFATSYVFSW